MKQTMAMEVFGESATKEATEEAWFGTIDEQHFKETVAESVEEPTRKRARHYVVFNEDLSTRGSKRNKV